jgi:hypothetical protein
MNDENMFSFNRLIEFGIGMSIAQQLVKNFSEAKYDNRQESVGNEKQIVNTKGYYAIIHGIQRGPFTEQEVIQLISEKQVVKETYIWREGMPSWTIAEKVPNFLRLVASGNEGGAKKSF